MILRVRPTLTRLQTNVTYTKAIVFYTKCEMTLVTDCWALHKPATHHVTRQPGRSIYGQIIAQTGFTAFGKGVSL